MGNATRHGAAIFVLALLITGCAKPEDKWLKEQISIMEQSADHYDKVTDKSSLDQVQPTITALFDRYGKLNEEINALPPDRKEAVKKKYEPLLVPAITRSTVARTKAMKAVGLDF